jgi:colanic acid/amylovoran biosynthesis glycosyltransferase
VLPTGEKKPRVAIFSGTIPSTTFIDRLIIGLAEKGMELVAIGNVTGRFSYPQNVRVIRVPNSFIPAFFFAFGQFIRLFVSQPRYARQLLRACMRNGKTRNQAAKNASYIFAMANAKVNILHVQWGKTLRTMPELFELRNTRIALSFRGTHINISPVADPELANIYRKYFPRINGFHAVSKTIAAEGEKYGAAPEKIKVIYTSVKGESEGTKADKKGGNSGVCRIISVGRAHWVKGYTYALMAMQYLKEANFPFHYTLVAEGKLDEELIYQIHDQGLSNHITIIPGMAHAALMESLPAFDVFLLSSVAEGIANVVLEGMNAGIPVISTNIGGMEEVIQDGENGFLVPPYSGEDIAKAIIRIGQMSPSEIDRVKANARKTLAEKFAPERQVDEFISFYTSLVAA